MERGDTAKDYWQHVERTWREKPGVRLQAIATVCSCAAFTLREGPLLPLAVIAGCVLILAPIGFLMWRRGLRRAEAESAQRERT
jgi:hypothetical protein